jgi:hypothetical protein
MKKLIVIIATLLVLVVGLSGCDWSSPNPTSTPDQSSSLSTNSQSTYNTADGVAPPYQVKNFSVRKQINSRVQQLDDPNLYGYFYEFVPGSPQPVLEVIVKGAVLPLDDTNLPSDVKAPCDGAYSGGTGNYSGCSVVVPGAQQDGSFGTNGTGVWGHAADGSYFEWSGIYHYSTKPAKFNGAILVIGCDAKAQQEGAC